LARITLRTLLFAGTKFSEISNFQKIANNSTCENYIWRQNFRIFRKENLKLSMATYVSLVSFPDPTLEEGRGLVTFERFLGSRKFNILTFAKANQIAALRFSCDRASGRAATIVQGQLAV
jgi:hypothetical protein